MPNIIKSIDIESAFIKIYDKLEYLITRRDERDTIWEKTVNECICDIERSAASSRMDGNKDQISK